MIDVNKPVTNPELVEIMEKFTHNRSAENEFAFIDRLGKAHFLVPIILQGELEDGVLKAGGTISFKTLTSTSGENYFMAFTDWQELAKWSAEREQTLISTYEDLKTLVLKDTEHIRGIAINPCSHNYVITPELMEYIAHRISPIVLEKGAKIELGQPANYPDAMVKALVAFFKKHKEVEEAYLFLAHRPEEPRPNLMLVINSTGVREALYPKIGAVAQEYLGKDEYIEIVAMEDVFAEEASRIAPFYQKKRWGVF